MLILEKYERRVPFEILLEMYTISSFNYLPHELYDRKLSLEAFRVLKEDDDANGNIWKVLTDTFNNIKEFLVKAPDNSKNQLSTLLLKDAGKELDTNKVTTTGLLNWMVGIMKKAGEKYPKLSGIMTQFQKFFLNYVMKNKLTVSVAYLLFFIAILILLKPVGKVVSAVVSAVFKLILHPVQTFRSFMTWIKGETKVDEVQSTV